MQCVRNLFIVSFDCFLLPFLPFFFFSLPFPPSCSPFSFTHPPCLSYIIPPFQFLLLFSLLASLFLFVPFFTTLSCEEIVTNKTDSLAPPATCRPQYKAGIKILAVSWSLVPPKKQGWNSELNYYKCILNYNIKSVTIKQLNYFWNDKLKV